MLNKTTKINSRERNSTDLIRAGILAVFMIGTAGNAAANEMEASASHSTHIKATTDASNHITASIPFRYVQYAGSTFLPLSSDAEYAYKGSGCIYKTGGTDKLFAHKVLLPEGAVIHYVRMYSFDANTSNSIRGFLTTYDAAGNYNELHASTSEDGGYGSVLSPLLNYTVDNNTRPINMVVNLGNATTSDLAFCGVRIAYKLPDLIFKNGFE